jgi:hypothetical protein
MGAVGVVLQPHAEMADVVGRLDEGAADIVVTDDAELERQARLGSVADRRRHAQSGTGTTTSAGTGLSVASCMPMLPRIVD